jgi:hypothetical protein
LREGKSVRSEKGKVLGCVLCYEQTEAQREEKKKEKVGK